MLKIELDTGFSKAFTGWWCLSGRDWLSGLGAEEVYEVAWALSSASQATCQSLSPPTHHSTQNWTKSNLKTIDLKLVFFGTVL